MAAPSIGTEKDPFFFGPGAERRDLSSRGIPAVMVVPSGARVEEGSFMLPGEETAAPALIITKFDTRLTLVNVPKFTRAQRLSTLTDYQVETREAGETSWSLVWQEESRLRVSAWRDGVLCEGEVADKRDLKDAVKLCEKVQPLAPTGP